MKTQHFCTLAVMIASVTSWPVAADIAIGFANPLSGTFAASGKRNQTAVELAVEDLNKNGGVLGEEVRLIVADDACGVEKAIEAARELVRADVAFVVGHGCSHSSLLAAGIYEAADTLMVSPDSTHPRLTEEGRRNVFRLIGRDDRQGAIAGDFLADHWSDKRIAIVHDGSVYGQGLAAETRSRLRELGVVEAVYAVYAPDEMRYPELISRLQSEAIDVLYVGGYGSDAGRILRTAREMGSNLQLIGGDGLGMDEFWIVAGKLGEGTIFSSRPGINQRPEAVEVVAALHEKGLGVRTSGVGAYAAVETWAEAVERAGTFDFEAVARTLRYGRFSTILGLVAFDPNGDLRGAGWEMQIWTRGNHRPLHQRTAVSSN